ncbi:DUF3822 family protein [Mesonia ostreae]|uniref:DUF3822 family protein n=1 Tax=Mesonia ostreae TaxID=861110 RepID=A0ABU2KKB3_9FLAO|nr:DUF3822 family protein [Mesonia ostreae]MDT0295162.1 DUF3822 family protein [Mesonia ostreae]
MVTGHKFMELTTNNIEPTKNKLSILIAQDGFSFCTGNKESHKVEDLKHKTFLSQQTPENLLKEIKLGIEQAFSKEEAVDELEVIYSNTLNTLVPDAFFTEENLTDYLKFNIKILATDYVTFDDVEAIKAKNVYIPYTNINNYLFEKFGEFSFKHITSSLIEFVKKRDLKTRVLLHVHPTHFHMIFFKEGELQLANSFNYQTKEDFIYYVLFVLEQLELDPLEIPILVFGHIEKEDSNYHMLSTYIKYLDLLKIDTTSIYLSENITANTQLHHLILSQF